MCVCGCRQLQVVGAFCLLSIMVVGIPYYFVFKKGYRVHLPCPMTSHSMPVCIVPAAWNRHTRHFRLVRLGDREADRTTYRTSTKNHILERLFQVLLSLTLLYTYLSDCLLLPCCVGCTICIVFSNAPHHGLPSANYKSSYYQPAPEGIIRVTLSPFRISFGIVSKLLCSDDSLAFLMS